MRDFDPTAGEFAGHDAIHPSSRKYDIGSIIGAGASLLGSAMSSDAAGDAAATQADATREANRLTKEQFDAIRQDLSPYRNLGAGGANMLANLLGISPQAMGGSGATGGVQSYDALRAELLPQFTKETQIGGYSTGNDEGSAWIPESIQKTIDERALQEAIQARMAQSFAQPQQPQANAPGFGSLLENFTGKDLQNEPGYQFGLNEGMKALDRRLASGGNYFSGAALKGAQRFGQDYAGTKFGDAFNRDSANKTRTYNFLSGATGMGQNAAAQTGNAGQTMAQQVGANTTGMANAAGAAQIAGANAWSGGLNNIGNMYQQNQLLNRITSGNRGWGSAGGWQGGGRVVPDYPGAEY